MIYPQAIWWPGAAAGYRWGRTAMLSTVCHFTVGRDSAGIGLRGTFQFLVRRNGEVVQFAEADARCFHAGDPYNSRGPGIEIEYLPGYDDTMFTDAQLTATGGLVRWLGQWMPLAYYDNPSARIGDWNGFISHRSITSNADYHSDYWDQADWDRMVGNQNTQKKGSAVIYVDVQAHIGLAMEGPIIVAEFNGPPNQYGIPQDAMDYAGTDIPLRVVPGLLLAKLRKADQYAMTAPTSGGGGAAVPLTVTLTGTATP